MIENPDDPAEAWAMIERFALAVVRAYWERFAGQLGDIGRMEPNPGVEAQMIRLLQEWNVATWLLEHYLGGCKTTMAMMQDHYRFFPTWKGPAPLDGPEAPVVK